MAATKKAKIAVAIFLLVCILSVFLAHAMGRAPTVAADGRRTFFDILEKAEFRGWSQDSRGAPRDAGSIGETARAKVLAYGRQPDRQAPTLRTGAV